MSPSSPEDPTDHDLVLRARAGDSAALTALLRRHGAGLKRMALRCTRNVADADDAVQEAAVRAWLNLHALREPAKVKSWMLQITAREALNRATSALQHHELTEDVALVAGPDVGVDVFDLHDGLRSALRVLPEQQRTVWLLRQAHGLTYREIADRMNSPESSVRGWLVLARKRIQAAVEECCLEARPKAVSVHLPLGRDAPPTVLPESAPVATAATPVRRGTITRSTPVSAPLSSNSLPADDTPQPAA